MAKATAKQAAKGREKKRDTLGVEIASMKHVQPRKRHAQPVKVLRQPAKRLEEDSMGLGDDNYEVDIDLLPKDVRSGLRGPLDQITVDRRALRQMRREAVLASAPADLEGRKDDLDALILFDQPAGQGEPGAPREADLLQNFERAFATQLEQAKASEGARTGAAPGSRPTTVRGVLAADPVLSQAFKETGEILAKYRSGPLPKLLKGVPASAFWEASLQLTNPEAWTPHATLEVTRYFVAQLPEDQAALYLQDFLLPRVRDALVGKSRLPVQLFEALGRATYKPRAFLKGIVFPCTQEACPAAFVRVLTSALRQGSVPMKVAAPAIYKLACQEWTPTVSAFLGALLDKGYTLPVSVVEQVVRHYEATAQQAPLSQQLPLVFHYSLLIFAKRYASAMTGDQQARLLAAVARCRHGGGISDEIVNVFRTSASGMAAVGSANEILI